jgi:thymidylate synthase
MNKLDRDYQALLQDVLNNGVKKADRTGTGTFSVFGRQLRHDMADGFPLLTTKRMAVKTMMTELKWFLKGDTNIKYLVDNKCAVWNGDAYKKYKTAYEIESRENSFALLDLHMLEDLTEAEFINRIKTDDTFAAKWGELGPIYGAQWRNWGSEVPFGDAISTLDIGIDQLKNVIHELKTNPDSRRLMVSAWNVNEMDNVTLPPCHYGFQVYTRETTKQEMIANPGKSRAISLMWNQRSVDTFLGLPFNIASYGMLLTLLAEEVDMVPDMLIGSLGDTHLYSNHVEQAKQQIEREPYVHLPKIKLGNIDILSGEFEYELIDYIHHPPIKAPLSN